MNAKLNKKKLFYSNIFSVESLKYYQTHIIEFVYDLIFQNNPDYFLSDQQKEFLLAIQNNDRVSAKSGKGIGKTAAVSYAIIWFICCFANPKIICTAPTFPTLKTALWPEVAKWLSRSVVKDLFEHTEKKLYLKESPKNWFCEPRTAKDKESAQGVHEDNLLVIMDEASGSREEIFEAYDTTLTSNNNKFVMIGNPTRTNGPFYDTFGKYGKRWVKLTFNAEKSPFVKKSQIEYYAEKYGIHHDLYLVNVKGQFPSGSPTAFIRLSDVHAAADRYDEVQPNGVIEIGLDVARYGDDLTVLYWRHGYKVYPAKVLPKSSIPDCRDLVFNTVKDIRRSTGYDKTIRVKVDDSGVGGGVVDLLKEDREHNIEVIPCNFGGKGGDKYANEASVMWANVKDLINVIGLPEDDTVLIEELAARRWKLSPNGKIMIEPKSEYKKEFKSSPDRADALILCFAQKEAERTVLRSFDKKDTRIVKKTLNYISEEKYCTMYYSQDLELSMLFSAWDGNQAYVFDEYVGDDSIISVATNIISHGQMRRILGNDRMFSNTGDCLEQRFRNFRVNVYENYNYNEAAAIETLNYMIQQKRIILSENCSKLINQLDTWIMEGSKLSREHSFGLCYSLCHLMSELKKRIDKPQIVRAVPAYSGEKNRLLDELRNPTTDSNRWMLN